MEVLGRIGEEMERGGEERWYKLLCAVNITSVTE